MTILEQIQRKIKQLPPEKQSEVLDFVNFLQKRSTTKIHPDHRPSLQQHPAFGSWKNRHIDPLKYEQALRSEWDQRQMESIRVPYQLSP